MVLSYKPIDSPASPVCCGVKLYRIQRAYRIVEDLIGTEFKGYCPGLHRILPSQCMIGSHVLP